LGNAEEKSAEAVVVKKAAERQQERRAEELRNGLATKLLGYSKVDGKPRKKKWALPKTRSGFFKGSRKCSLRECSKGGLE